MPRVRGIVVLNTIRFVRDTFGAQAHETVLTALPPSVSATLQGPIREASWEPLEAVESYMEAAKRLLAPADPAFYRALGRFSGRLDRHTGGFAPMVAEPTTSLRLAPVVWQSFYDVGRLEVCVQGATHGVGRIHGFPASRALCQRICGSFEGLLSTDTLTARAEETACVLDGSPYCEIRVDWG